MYHTCHRWQVQLEIYHMLDFINYYLNLYLNLVLYLNLDYLMARFWFDLSFIFKFENLHAFLNVFFLSSLLSPRILLKMFFQVQEVSLVFLYLHISMCWCQKEIVRSFWHFIKLWFFLDLSIVDVKKKKIIWTCQNLGK